MANLPNKPFVFNYNARDFNANTYTIPNEIGASMDRDMVWSGSTRGDIVAYDDHISVPLSAYSVFDFSTSEANPMNNRPDSPAMTIVAKFKIINNDSGSNLICNRHAGAYNWMMRTSASDISLHTLNANTSSSQTAAYTKSDITTAVIRVNSNRQIEIKNLTQGISNTPFTTNWTDGSRWFSFFVWYTANGISEPMSGDYYWCYASREVLTDEEIQQVVRYNDSKFGPDDTGTTMAASGGTSTTNIEAETGWTVTSSPSWVTVSPSSGESGTTAITFTIKANNFTSRTGTVVFTDDEGNTAEYVINQGGTDGLVPYEKIYRNERRIN